jgi:predicted aspartyl protease
MTTYMRTRRALMLALPGLCLAGGSIAFDATAHAQQTGTRIGIDHDPDGLRVMDEFDAWIDKFGRPTAKVMLNGQGPFQFLVDTGSTTTVLAKRVSDRIAAPTIGIVMVNGTTGTAEMPVANVAILETGVVTKKDIRVAVLPDAGLAREDGILGADVFAGRRIRFDIAAKSVRVESSRRAARTAPVANIKIRNGLLAEIDGRIGTVKAKLMLDTGAQQCIVNPKLAATLIRTYPRMRRYDRAEVIGVTGHLISGTYLALPRIDMDKVEIRDAGAIAADAPIFSVWNLQNEPAMIVGVDVLSRLDEFSIDYGTKVFEAAPMALMARGQNMLG